MHYSILIAIAVFGNIYTIFRGIKYLDLLKKEDKNAKNKLLDLYVAAFFFGTPALAYFTLLNKRFVEAEKENKYLSLKVLLVFLVIQALILFLLFYFNAIKY